MRQFSLAGLRLPWGPGAPESLHGGPCEGVSVAPAVPSSLIPAWRGERCPEQGCALWIFIPCLPGMGTSSSIHQRPESPRAGGSQLASHDHTRIHSHKHMCTHMHTYVHTHTHPQAHTHTHSPGVPAGPGPPAEEQALTQGRGPGGAAPHPQVSPPQLTIGCCHCDPWAEPDRKMSDYPSNGGRGWGNRSSERLRSLSKVTQQLSEQEGLRALGHPGTGAAAPPGSAGGGGFWFTPSGPERPPCSRPGKPGSHLARLPGASLGLGDSECCLEETTARVSCPRLPRPRPHPRPLQDSQGPPHLPDPSSNSPGPTHISQAPPTCQALP